MRRHAAQAPAKVVAPFVVAAMLMVAGCLGTPEDEDGLQADIEKEGWAVTVTEADGLTRTYHVTSSPFKADEDRDGVEDSVELLQGLDPRSPDTDSDGLLDGYDVLVPEGDKRAKTWSPLGIRWVQGETGLVFLGERGDGNVARGGEPTRADTDADGIIDGDEAGGFTVLIPSRGEVTLITGVYRADTDGDGILDGAERRLGLDATARDTDGDGVHDSADLNPWHDLGASLSVQGMTLQTERTVWLSVNGLDAVETYSRSATIGPSGGAIHEFNLTGLNPSDDGGSVLKGRHNLSFLVQVLRVDGASTQTVDVFGDDTGTPWVEAQMHALTGALVWRDSGGQFVAWPDAPFSGPDGTMELRVEHLFL